jgi:hypothetical protein
MRYAPMLRRKRSPPLHSFRSTESNIFQNPGPVAKKTTMEHCVIALSLSREIKRRYNRRVKIGKLEYEEETITGSRLRTLPSVFTML